MNLHTLNFWAILAAAVSAFLLGGLWYSPAVFGKAWQRANAFTEAPAPTNMARIFGISFLLTLIMSINLAMFLNTPATTTAFGAAAGFAAGFGWVATGIGVVSLFERRPWTYVLINGGYLTLALTLMGAILGAWR
ncbi:MAG TPA: DUF1761 domain-containing protein [Acidobacteriaceae bacterium]